MNETKSDFEIVEDVSLVAYSIWRRTDFDKVSASRDLKDEFASRIRTAAYTDSVASFFERLSSKWGVRCPDDHDQDVFTTVKEYDSAVGSARKFLRIARNHAALVVLQMHENHGDSK